MHRSRQLPCPLNRRPCRMYTRRRYLPYKDLCIAGAVERTDIKCAASVSRCRRTHARIYRSRHAEETICKRIPGAGRHPCRILYNLISPDCCHDSPSAGFFPDMSYSSGISSISSGLNTATSGCFQLMFTLQYLHFPSSGSNT